MAKRDRILARGILGIAVCWISTQTIAAQDSRPQEPPAETPKQLPIPAAEIPGRSEQTAEQLQSIRERLERSDATARVDSLLPEYIAKIHDQMKRDETRQLTRQTLKALGERQEQWNRFASRLGDWRSALEERARQLEDIRTELQEMRDEWEATQSASQAEELPAALRATTRTVLTAIAEHETLLQRRRTAVLALLKKVSDQSLQVSETLRLIEQAMGGYTGLLFERDSPPLWGIFEEDEAQSRGEDFVSANQRKIAVFTESLTTHLTPLVVHLVGGAVLLAMLVILRRKSKLLLASDPRGRERDVPLILRRPISTTLVAILIIIRFSIPEAPTVFFRVIGVLLLIPMLRLLPLYLPRFYRRAFYVLSGLYLLHRVEALSIDMPILYRLLLLLLTVSAVASIAWFERSLFRHKSDPDVPRRFWHAVVSRGAGTLLMVSLGANIVGAVALSEMLTEGTLNSLYSMLVLTAGVFVFSDLFDLILRTRVSQTLRMVKDAQEVLSLQWTKVLKFAAAVIWTILALSNFNLWIPAWSAVADLLAKEWTVGTWTFSFGSILALVLTIWISVQLSRLLRFALETDVLPRTNLRRGVQSTISSMAYYLALLSGLILATSMIGFKWDTIAIIIGALGVGIGFGLQNLVNNVVSGLILMFERPINVGDTIEFGGRFGDVLRIGLRASTVRTFDGSEVIVPNANLVSSEVVNWTLSDRNRRMEITVGVEYGSDPETVLSVLLRVVRQHPKVMQSPDPFAWFMGFGDSSLDFVVKFWCQFEDAYTARSEIMTSINHALREAGIVIPFPQRDLHVRSVDPRIQESLSPRKDSNR